MLQQRGASFGEPAKRETHPGVTLAPSCYFKKEHQPSAGAPEVAVSPLPAPAALSSSQCQARLLEPLFKGSAPHPAVLREGVIAAQLAAGAARAAPWESSL